MVRKNRVVAPFRLLFHPSGSKKFIPWAFGPRDKFFLSLEWNTSFRVQNLILPFRWLRNSPLHAHVLGRLISRKKYSSKKWSLQHCVHISQCGKTRNSISSKKIREIISLLTSLVKILLSRNFINPEILSRGKTFREINSLVISNFFNKNVTFTKFLPIKCEREFPHFPQSTQHCTVEKQEFYCHAIVIFSSNQFREEFSNLAKKLISRNFWDKIVTINFMFFHAAVHWEVLFFIHWNPWKQKAVHT